MERKITTSKVFDGIRNSDSKIIVLEGSSRSTKTYSVIQFLISIALDNENRKRPRRLRIAIVRARLTWIKNTVLVDFKDILRDQFGMWDEKDFNKSEFIYKFGHTEFSFTGLDHEQGQKFHGAKYDYVWFNESLECDYPSVMQILLRLTGRAIFDYNPNFDERHWIETKIKTRDDACVMHSTYKDNPFLDEKIVDEIEKLEPTEENIRQGTADETSWKIYGLGLRAVLKGLIFQFSIIEMFPDRNDYVYGLDFGFSNDPTALTRGCIVNKELIIDELLYEKGLTNIDNPNYTSQMSIERRFAEIGVGSTKLIIADSSDPKAIQDIKNCGYNIRPCVKGPNSILSGINTMKEYPIKITERSLNTIDEFRKYKWLESRDGESTNKPIDKFNHCIDSIRYFIQGIEETGRRSNYGYDSCKARFNLSKYGG